MEVLSGAVRAPGVIGDVEEPVPVTVGESSPRPLQMEAAGGL